MGSINTSDCIFCGTEDCRSKFEIQLNGKLTRLDLNCGVDSSFEDNVTIDFIVQKLLKVNSEDWKRILEEDLRFRRPVTLPVCDDCKTKVLLYYRYYQQSVNNSMNFLENGLEASQIDIMELVLKSNGNCERGFNFWDSVKYAMFSDGLGQAHVAQSPEDGTAYYDSLMASSATGFCMDLISDDVVVSPGSMEYFVLSLAPAESLSSLLVDEPQPMPNRISPESPSITAENHNSNMEAEDDMEIQEIPVPVKSAPELITIDDSDDEIEEITGGLREC